MKKSLLVLTVLAICLMVAAVPVFAESLTLRYFMWDPEFQDAELELISLYEEENPGIEIDFTAMNPENYWPNLASMAAAEQLPDVFNMSTGYLEEWAEEGRLLSLEDFVAENITEDEYFTEVFTAVRYPDEDGELHAMPYAWVTPVLYYNKDMFDAAGVDYPDDDWTWDDFTEAAIALNNPPESYGFWWYGRYTHVEPWIYANGGQVLNEDRTRVELDSAAREALQFLDELANEHGVSPEPAMMEGIRQQDVFPLQQAAMWVDGSWMVEEVRSVVDGEFDWGIAKVPAGPSAEDKGYYSYVWPDSIAISADTEKVEESMDFLEFLVSEDRPLDSYMAGKVPIYQPLAETEEWLQPDKSPGNLEIILELGEMETRNTFTQGWGEWRGYVEGAGMEGELNRVANGDQTLEEAIERFTEHSNDVLSRYYD